MGKKLNILSIDGGGIRGAMPLYFLNQIEKKYSIYIRDHFDMIAGTSTGAIIGTSIICENPQTDEFNSIDEILDIYINRSNQIFIQKEHTETKYSNQGLELILKYFFGNKTLLDLKKTMVLPLHDITINKEEIISQWNEESTEKYGAIPLYKILLAAGASQGYFSPVNINGNIMGDGVVFIKNPTVAALELAMKKGYELNDINILSLGTGSLDTFDAVENQAITTDQQVKLMYEKHRISKQYVRLQAPIITASQDMDNTDSNNLKALISDAKTYLKDKKRALEKVSHILK